MILALDILECDNGSGLLVDDGAETSLALHDDVGNTHLAAESGQEDNELDRINVMGDDNKRGLLGLDESDYVVETVLDEEGLLGLLQNK